MEKLSGNLSRAVRQNWEWPFFPFTRSPTVVHGGGRSLPTSFTLHSWVASSPQTDCALLPQTRREGPDADSHTLREPLKSKDEP